MTILAVQRFVLVAPAVDREPLLGGLQDLGAAHLEPLDGSRTTAPALDQLLEGRGRRVADALRILLTARPRRRQLHDEDRFDLDAVVEQVHDAEHRRALLEDERDRLEARIKELSPWGRFRFPDPAQLGGQRLWFYEVPLARRARVERSGLVWQEVHRDSRRSWIVVVATAEPSPDAMPVPRTHTGGVSLADLEERIEQVEAELDEVHSGLLAQTRWIDLILRNLARAEDHAARHEATALLREQGPLCLVAGWAPVAELAALRNFAESHSAALLIGEPAADEHPPTLLDNPGNFAGGGEQLVSFYQTPNARDWDPSPVVAFSFAAFFAMILADAGYALLLSLGLVWGWRRMGRSPVGRRLRALAAVMLAASVGYGALCGSWFGVTPAASSALARLQVLDLGDFDSMMTLSVLVGCAHLALANLVVAWRAPGLAAGLPNLGWIAVLAGGLGRWLDPTRGWGMPTAIAGLALVLLFTSRRPVRGPLDLLKRLGGGALALTNITRLFGDVLSYLRLFALGLASSSLAVTFNGMAVDIRESVPGLGVFLALLVLLVGHAINLALGLVGGFVHGLRLNFIEFYQWGLGEEGRPFRRFARKEANR